MYFINDTNNYLFFLQELQQQIGGTLQDGLYRFPAHIADGYIRYVELGDETNLIITNYQQKTDITHFRLPSLPEIFILRMHMIKNTGTIEVEIDDSSITDNSANYAGILLTSSAQKIRYMLPAGTSVNSANLVFNPQKLYNYFPGYDMQKLVKQHVLKKAKGYNSVPMNFNSRQAFAECLKLVPEDPFYMLSMQARMFEIADYFFEMLISKKDEKPISEKTLAELEKISELDLNRMDKLDQPLPTVEELAQQVFMSPSKFKVLFKQLYGEPVYDYFNTGRLNIARRQLLQGNASIKELAFLMGFKNSAQFSSAFKKYFGFSPTDIKLQTFES